MAGAGGVGEVPGRSRRMGQIAIMDTMISVLQGGRGRGGSSEAMRKGVSRGAPYAYGGCMTLPWRRCSRQVPVTGDPGSGCVCAWDV